MKKLLIILFLSAFGTASMADSITIFNGSSPGGTLGIRGEIIKEGLEALGHDVKMINTKGHNTAYKLYSQHNGTKLLATATPVAALYEPKIKKNELVAYEYSDPLFLCKRADAPNVDQKTTVKVGYGKTYPIGIIKSVDKKLNIDFEYVPLKSSGTVLKTIIAGDVQYQYNNAGRTKKFLSTGGQCLFNTGTTERYGIPPLSKYLPEVKYNVISNSAIVIGSEKLHNDLNKVFAGEQYQAFLKKNGYQFEGGRTIKAEQEQFWNEIAEFWK